jgi:hypothetical protein
MGDFISPMPREWAMFCCLPYQWLNAIAETLLNRLLRGSPIVLLRPRDELAAA